MYRHLFLLFAASLFASTALAQDSTGVILTEDQKSEVVRSLGEALEANYVFPKIGQKTAEELLRRSAAGNYANADESEAFADALNADLRQVGNDRHLRLLFAPNLPERQPRDEGPPTSEDVARMLANHQREAFGIHQVSRLPGNIGYLDIRSFGMPEFVGPAYESALQLLAGSDAMVIDLRSNGGGSPASVAQLMSHFFAKGDTRHVNSIYNREQDETRDFWTDPTVETRYTGPVFVLTSGYTFSGGEEFAYDMQTQERATLIGETTGGGANPGTRVRLAHGFAAFIPTGRAINPITGTNWEHVGVKPEVASSANEAIHLAYAAALEAANEGDLDERRLQRNKALIADAKAGKMEFPEWKDPRG